MRIEEIVYLLTSKDRVGRSALVDSASKPFFFQVGGGNSSTTLPPPNAGFVRSWDFIRVGISNPGIAAGDYIRLTWFNAPPNLGGFDLVTHRVVAFTNALDDIPLVGGMTGAVSLNNGQISTYGIAPLLLGLTDVVKVVYQPAGAVAQVTNIFGRYIDLPI